jgi:hypothetical protein
MNCEFESTWKEEIVAFGVLFLHLENRDSSVGIALGYRMGDRGCRIRLPAGSGNFSLNHRVHNGSGAYPASYPMGTSGSFPRGKVSGA